MRYRLQIILVVTLSFHSFIQNSEASPYFTKSSFKANLFTVFTLLNSPMVFAQRNDIELCCLCDGCGSAVSDRGGLYVDANGKTCTDLILEMADPNNDSTYESEECSQLVDLHSARCCDPSYNPIPIEQNPTTPPGPLEPGDEPPCDICHDGSFPGNLNTVIAVLEDFLTGGPFTCKELYWMGRNGHISDQICNPLVDYAEGPCGCLSPQPNSPPTSSPVNDLDFPPKKDRPDDASKDSTKLFDGDGRQRGGIHLRLARKTRLKGR